MACHPSTLLYVWPHDLGISECKQEKYFALLFLNIKMLGLEAYSEITINSVV
jgi:hypothetical protein